MIKKGRLLNYAFFNNLAVQSFDGEKLYISTGNSDDFENGEKVTYEKRPSRANLQVDEGTVLFAKMKGTRKTLLIDEKMKENIYSTGFCALKSNFFASKYFYYLIASDEFNKEKDSYSFGTTQEAINETRLKQISLEFVVDFESQQAIANYLDEKVGKIDELIAEQNQVIENWKAYKQSLIAETVTKGLNPNVEMKDSGIEWIGEIPKEWETVFINQIFTQTKNKNIDLQEKNLLSLSYGKIIRKNIETREGLLPENFNTYNIINSGDIVLRLTDLQNDQRSLRCGIAKEKGIITSAYITLRNVKPIINDYYYYLIHSYDIMKVFYGMGSGVRQGLTFEGLKRMRLLVPSLHEQQAIADFLDKKCSKIDQTIEQKQTLIKQLEEYKQSLIYECVTGKRCVL